MLGEENMKKAVMIQPAIENNRIELGITYIEKALRENGYDISVSAEEPGNDYRKQEGMKIYVGDRTSSSYIKDLEERGLLIYHREKPQAEGFYLNVIAPKLCVVSGGDATGALYGCLELAERIKKEGKIPEVLAYQDAPVYKLMSLKPDAADGEQEYTMTININGGTEPFVFKLPNLKALFRNTNVVVDITLYNNNEIAVDVIPYSEIILEPVFGL